MRMYEVINKKKRGEVLTGEEIRWAIAGYTSGEIPDYQMSALLMAVYFRGMNAAETSALTMAMVDSGERVDLSQVVANITKRWESLYDGWSESGGKVITVDKHSTGGVGDKTTLAVVPIVAACGVPIAKMSGRGLGHTGGTVDKLEAIPRFRTKLTGAEFMGIVENLGLCIAGQSANLAPADKKLYALRDVTATVDSIPLIAASIMSKKIAAGADAILLDVKTGSGAFMKELDDARKLAQAMVDIGNGCGRKTAALITDMSEPLGCAIGNSLELREVLLYLKGKLSCSQTQNLRALCEALAVNMLLLAEKGDPQECFAQVKEAITSGRALKTLKDMIEAQGGDLSYVEKLESETPRESVLAEHITTVKSPKSGYISKMDTEGIGLAAMTLGAGREKPEDEIDYEAGIILNIKLGDYIEAGQPLAELHTSNEDATTEATAKFLSALTFADTPPKQAPIIHEKIE